MKTKWKVWTIIILLTASAVVFLRFDPLRRFTDPTSFLQDCAIYRDHAAWGHWGTNPKEFTSWTSHSNRLIPVYTFGISLDPFAGDNSIYRDPDRLRQLYGRLPQMTAHPNADYLDQTDIHALQWLAIEQGKKFIFLIVFDGMDWQTTWAASIYRNRGVSYRQGRGQGLAFLDYDKTETDFGFFVCSPYNDVTSFDVDAQVVTGRNERLLGGYNPLVGGFYPWDIPASYPYLIGEDRGVMHAYTDSAASATSMMSGIKTYNGAINVDHNGNQVLPIARKLQSRGYSIGAVTSVPFSHATPAAAYANNVSRGDYQDISRDLLGLSSNANRRPLPGMDVIIGTGWGIQPKDKNEQKEQLKEQGINYERGNIYLTDQDLAKIDAEHGGKYQIAIRQSGLSGQVTLQKATELAIQNGNRLFGWFGTSESHLPFATANGDYKPTNGESKREVYSKADVHENPTLCDMTDAALKVLEQNKTGFWLLVEPGDVDWANHQNNIDDAIGAVFSGEAAFQTVVDWIERNDCWQDSVVIVTADHGHLLVLDEPEALIPN